MTERFPIPDAETRRKEVERLREGNRQLELFNLELDELIAMVEVDLRRQRRERLERSGRIGLHEVGD
jgi:hypothetical protein